MSSLCGGLFAACGATVVDDDDAKPDQLRAMVMPESVPMSSVASRARRATDIRELELRIAANEYGPVQPHGSARSDVRIFDANLFEDPHRDENLRGYYNLCRDAQCLVVTMSCFAIWAKHGKTNGFAKVIPAVRTSALEPALEPAVTHPSTGSCRCCASVNESGEGVQNDDAGLGNNVRVMFFDDNLDMEGFEHSPGICNLRDLATGEYVNFGVDHNGFVCEHVATHTVVHHSTLYSNVLVKANILDAIEDSEYFLKIIRRYAKPGEHILVYMDINSAIVCGDSVSGKSPSSILLSTMFEFIEFKPREEVGFTWKSFPSLKIKGDMCLKAIIKKIAGDNKDYYNSFYSLEDCLIFFTELKALGDIRWKSQDTPITVEDFRDAYDRYLAAISGEALDSGIAKSWFYCFETMRTTGHTAVLNSFGIDTKVVVEKTVPDVREVLQLTINFKLWEPRDAKKFEAQYCSVKPSDCT